MEKKMFDLQMFAAEEGTVMASDIEPAISIDFISRLRKNIDALRRVLGIVDIDNVVAGSNIKIYETRVTNDPEQVAEGETIALTHVERKLVKTIEMELKKFRKKTTAEDIMKNGRERAINDTDNALIGKIQKGIKQDFFDLLMEGTGEAEGVGLQAALANGWAQIETLYEDYDATAVYFVSPTDVADYLANTQVTMQNAFGLTYLENFLGLGTAVVSPRIPAGKYAVTAKENLRAANAGANGSDVAKTFGLTHDETGIIGITHSVQTGNATIETLMMAAIQFYPEYLDKVVVGTIQPAAGA